MMKPKFFMFFLTLVCISMAFFSNTFIQNSNSKDPVAPPIATTLPPELLEYEKNTIQVYEKSNLSVVNITTSQLARTWGYGTVEVPRGAGSGIVWNSDGYVITNFHVVQGGDNFIVSFPKDSKQYKAKIVGVAPTKDVAVLKLIEKPARLYPITLGISKGLMVGQKVIAIGNPFGLDQTATTGIVSALDRKIEGIGEVKIYGMIQTDASINPGNSGGPLLDSRGRLIGMNTMIYSQSGSSAGVGFAVPVDIIGQIVPQLIKHGKLIRPGLGIGILPEQYKETFGIDKGVVITHMSENGPAAKAGLRGMSQDQYGRYYIGDIIIALDDQEINTYDDLYNILDLFKIGDQVEVTYIREGKVRKTKIKLIQLD